MAHIVTTLTRKGRVRVKLTLEQATKTQKGSIDVALLFFLSARWGWVVNAMVRSLYRRERTSTHCMRGWVGPRVWAGAENLFPTGIRSPDRPARSESQYRLSYHGPSLQLEHTVAKKESIAV